MRGFLVVAIVLSLFVAAVSAPRPIHQYVYFNTERERVATDPFLSVPALEGAQIKYTWRQLEPRADEYDFSAVEEDLALLTARGKRLFLQVQDASFSVQWQTVPKYLLQDPQYH